MAFISFHYNKNILYAISYWAVEIIMRSLIHFKRELFQIYKKEDINEYMFVFFMDVGDLLSIFLIIYIVCSFKKNDIKEDTENNEKNPNNDNTNIELIANTDYKTSFVLTKQFVFKMIIICIFDFLNRSDFFIFYLINTTAYHDDVSHKMQFDIINHIDIIARYILSIYLLKAKVFKHHKLSIFIIFIGFIILIPTNAISIHFFPQGKNERLTYIYISIFAFRGILLPLEDIIEKKIFLKNNILPEHLMFFRGLGEFVLFIFLTPIFFFSKWNKEPDYFELASSAGSIALVTIIFITSSFIKAYLVLKVIYKFSAQSVSFLIVSESITYSIAEIIKFAISDKRDSELIVFLLLDILVIIITAIGTLIYDEILVIKKWGLDLNIAHKISKRAMREINSLYHLYSDALIEIDDVNRNEEKRKKSLEMPEIYN